MSAKATRTRPIQDACAVAAPRKRSRILVVEDHPLMREGIATWISREPDMEVCAQAGSAGEALRILEKLRPDLVLVDIHLPGRSGLELLKDLKPLFPDLPVVVLSMFDEEAYALRALRAGARGYVMKKAGGETVVAAIRDVMAGRRAFSPEVTEQIMDDYSGRERGHRSPLGMLTDREFEVFQHLGRGLTNGEIARRMSISAKTVECHRLSVRRKLKIKSTPQLIRYAVQYTQREVFADEAG
jgi:DNA-binding NarL/FixJ family response regulator